jgi:membrane protein implicated in regulation of membrane protease activity
VDDSTYLHRLLDAVKSAYRVDPTRVYFVGHSNGGFMAYRMACEHATEITAIVSLAGAGAAIAAIVFVLASALVFATLRPVARRHRHLPPSIRTGAAALVGKPAVVLERIANEEGVGCVRIDGGEVWTARSFDDHEVIDAGERVQVVEIRGATALVMH